MSEFIRARARARVRARARNSNSFISNYFPVQVKRIIFGHGHAHGHVRDNSAIASKGLNPKLAIVTFGLQNYTSVTIDC